MKEILFRGKRRDNGEWVYGDFTRYSEAESIINVDLLENETYWVLTETVGQFTGLLDKNGKKIFEGDVVDVTYSDREGNTHYMKMEMKNPFDYTIEDAISLDYSNQLEIIGNIHDDPKSLGEDHE